jgi:hypothetical protein
MQIMFTWIKRLLLTASFLALIITNFLTLTSAAFNAAVSGWCFSFYKKWHIITNLGSRPWGLGSSRSVLRVYRAILVTESYYEHT